MTRNASHLHSARVARADEFYTRRGTIEKEMAFHRTSFRGKAVHCCCDDPYRSAFVEYFIDHFADLGLARLEATNHVDSGTLLFDLSEDRPWHLCVTTVPDGVHGIDELVRCDGNSMECLRGDGDFRSAEVRKIMRGCDVVVTNPPFSLMRDFLDVVGREQVDLLCLATSMVPVLSTVFRRFQRREWWIGESIHSGGTQFTIPEDYDSSRAASCGRDEHGSFIRVTGIRWISSLDEPHVSLKLTASYDPDRYPTLDGVDAIHVDRLSEIPKDFGGVMAVPITFLDVWDVNQFEVIGMLGGAASLVGDIPHTVDDPIVNGECKFKRILIRRRDMPATP